MARAHTVAFSSSVCTTRLIYQSRREAKRACAEHYRTKFFTLCGIIATYEGRCKVKRRRKKGVARFPLRPTLELEPVPIIALFDVWFTGHMARARMEP